MLNTIRWVAWLPLALIASAGTGALATWFTEFSEGSPWYVWTVSGAVSGWAFFYVAIRVAPVTSTFVKWASIITVGGIGVMAGLGFLMGPDPIRALTGVMMVGMAIYYARLPISRLRGDVVGS